HPFRIAYYSECLVKFLCRPQLMSHFYKEINVIPLRHSFCFALVLAFCGVVAVPAHADPKPWIWSWWPSHWENQNFQPYLEDVKQPHNSQWDHKNWEPADWAAQKAGGSKDVIQGFYDAGILRGQDTKRDVPVLIVGPNF